MTGSDQKILSWYIFWGGQMYWCIKGTREKFSISHDLKWTDWRFIPVAVAWFLGTSRGCCCSILLVLLLYFLPPWCLNILEIMLIVSANLWKGRRWLNTSQSRALGASSGVYINFCLWKMVSPASFKQKCQANVYRGLMLPGAEL